MQVRLFAQQHLMSFERIARRYEAQSARLEALEQRTTQMETLFGEQLDLFREVHCRNLKKKFISIIRPPIIGGILLKKNNAKMNTSNDTLS